MGSAIGGAVHLVINAFVGVVTAVANQIRTGITIYRSVNNHSGISRKRGVTPVDGVMEYDDE